MTRLAAPLFALGLVFGGAGCGDDSVAPQPDAAPDSACQHRCGNGMVECGEQCDDGNTTSGDGCSATCQSECGDGILQSGEKCDTAIPAGMPGACPTSCDDMMACTTDSLTGSRCQQECVHGAITACANGDMCCPSGCNASNDSDCAAGCGNGRVDPGETCDTAITSGAGKCPTAADCDDMNPCTSDSLQNGGTCTAACSHMNVTACMGGDMCCPSGCTVSNDSDCANCGNGRLDPGETCDTAITAGAGKCPTLADCNDANSCTVDGVAGAGTCNAMCTHTNITMCVGGDNCCPMNCNANNDSNCQPRCGNGVIEAGEQCDDGNTTSGDGCSSTCQNEPTAFRVTQMFLRDPHVWLVPPLIGGCPDVTDNTPLGMSQSVNGRLNAAITMDASPMDGKLDLSILFVFNPLNQAAATNMVNLLTQADCDPPSPGTNCRPRMGATIVMSTVTNQSSGECLPILPGTVLPYAPPVTVPTGSPNAKCFASNAETVSFPVAGTTITLHDARGAATYSGNPATMLVTGEIRGFIPETEANNTMVNISGVYMGPLSGLLPGGVNNCHIASPMTGDKDTAPDGTVGWYFYLNFQATKVPFTP